MGCDLYNYQSGEIAGRAAGSLIWNKRSDKGGVFLSVDSSCEPW